MVLTAVMAEVREAPPNICDMRQSLALDSSDYLLVRRKSKIAQYQADKMVYYFTSNVTSPSAYIYMGKDKVESQQPFVAFNIRGSR